MTPMQELTTISTPDLIAELVGRCSPAVFIGYKDEGAGSGGVNVFSNSVGDARVCFGLCHQMALHIQLKEITNAKEDGA